LPGAGLTLFNPFPTATGSVGVGALLPGAGLTLFNPFPTAIGSVGVGRLLPGAGLTLFNPFPTATGSVGVGALLPGAALTLFNPITMSLVSGNNQTGAAGSRLANPLVVLVKDTLGRPVAGVAATFTVTAGGGTVSVTGTGGSAVTTAATNLQGFASVTWTLGSTPGSNTVTATSVGVLGSPVTFNATGN